MTTKTVTAAIKIWEENGKLMASMRGIPFPVLLIFQAEGVDISEFVMPYKENHIANLAEEDCELESVTVHG